MFALLIITRILFIACMVFIIGYVFGGFSKRKGLRTITRIAAVLLIVLFASMNFIVRGSHGGFDCHSSSYREQWHQEKYEHGYPHQHRDTLSQPIH